MKYFKSLDLQLTTFHYKIRYFSIHFYKKLSIISIQLILTVKILFLSYFLTPLTHIQMPKNIIANVTQFINFYNIYSMLRTPLHTHNEQAQGFMAVFDKIKNQSTYRFMYSDIDSFVSKVSKIIDKDIRQPQLTIKVSDHNILLHQLKMNFTKLIDDINMIQLHNLAISIEYVFDKLLTCLQNYFGNLAVCVQNLNEEIGLNTNRYIYNNKCMECQKNFNHSRIEGMMNSMTIAHHKEDYRHHEKDKKIDELSIENQDNELSDLINEMLQRKELILNSKNQRISNIYDEIVEYLESIPQSTINFTKESTKTAPTQFLLSNFSEEFDKNLEDVLKHPLKKLIRRVLQFARQLYCKKKQHFSVETQTLMIKDEENIKILLKTNEDLKKQLYQVKKLKRQAELNMVKMLDSEQKTQIKISQLVTENKFLQQRLGRVSIQLDTVKFKLQATEASKKQMSEKIVKDYTTERAVLLKTIRQLQLKIQATDHELMRLRKQTQNQMISQEIQTEDFNLMCAETQTQEDGKFSSSFHTRKNPLKLINSRIGPTQMTNSQLLEQNPGQNKPPIEVEAKIEEEKQKEVEGFGQDIESIKQLPSQLPRAKQKMLRKKLSIDYMGIEENFQQQNLHVSVYSKENRFNGYKKYSQNIGNLPQEDLNQIRRSHKSELEIGLQIKNLPIKKQRAKDQQSNWKEGEGKKSWQSGTSIRSKGRVDSSRMFLSKAHCSPYIGSNSSTPSYFQTPWFTNLEVNTLRKDSLLKTEPQKDFQNIQKVKFVSRLMNQYSRLKQRGLLVKINEIVTINQMDIQCDPQSIESRNSLYKSQEKKNEDKKVNDKGVQEKVSREKAGKIVQKSRLNKIKAAKQNFIIPPAPTFSFNTKKQTYTLTKNQVLLLFISKQNTKKYEQSLDIWSQLQNSIMLDNNFMSFCDSIEIFLNQIRTNQLNFYNDLVKFMIQPSKYLIDDPNLSIRNNKFLTSALRKVGHQRHFSSNATLSHFPQNFSFRKCDLTPHDLRNKFHKILRFHKILHKRCNHVEQFLSSIGMNVYNK